MGISFAALILIVAILAFVALAALLVIVTVAVTSRRSYAGPSNPDAAPCPKCGSLVPLSKRDCPACGARVA